jgi:class 3 adenylate cyclase
MSDVRNFTTLTERTDPEVLVHDLNRYFSEMVEIIRREGGLVDKFIGDGILAVFGLDDPEHASKRAVRTALEMQAAVMKLKLELSIPIEIGIGIHRGEVIAGNIGSTERMEFTFIGDAVNTAARLEGLTKGLGASIVISSAIHSELAGNAAKLPWKHFEKQVLKGKTEMVSVYGIPIAT